MKRIALFLLTNIAVVAVLGIVASLLGVNRSTVHRRIQRMLGQRQVHRYRGHGCQRWCHPADLAGGRRR